MRIGYLSVVLILAGVLTSGCTYDTYVPDTPKMSVKMDVFNTARDVVKKYAYALRENPTTGEIEGLLFHGNHFLDSTRGSIFVKIYKVSDGYYEPDVRVKYEIDVSQVDPFSNRQAMQEWMPVHFARPLEMKVKKEILAKLGMDFKEKEPLEAEHPLEPEKTEPQPVEMQVPESVKAAKTALDTKLDKIAFDGLTLEAAVKELSSLTGVNMVISREAVRTAEELGVKVKLSLNNLKASSVVKLMLKNAGEMFFYHMDRDGVVVIDILNYHGTPSQAR